MWYDARGHNRIVANYRTRNVDKIRKENLVAFHKKYATKEGHTHIRRVQNAYYHKQGKYLRYERLYGLTHEQYDELLAKQEYACATCRQKKPLDVDHDHQTGKVRGLLCRRCNIAIGQFEDDPDLIDRIASYLRG